MNCDWVQENITLYLYNELADDARHEVEQHIARCTDLRRRARRSAGIPGADERACRWKSRRPASWRPPACGCRNRWRQRAAATARGITASPSIPSAWLRQVRFSPALAAVILIVGFGGGIGTMYRP